VHHGREDGRDVHRALLAEWAPIAVGGGWEWTRLGGGRRGRRDAEEGAASIESSMATVIAEETGVPNADEAPRQYVEQEPPEKLVADERHHLHAVVVRIVFPTEAHDPVDDIDETVIRDRDAMRVARQVRQDAHGPAKRRLGVHDPRLLVERVEEAAPGRGIRQGRGAAGKRETVAIMGASEAVEELRATHDREGPHGEEKRRPARDPSCAVGAEGAARHDTVEVDVLGERLAPGVEDGRDADGPTEVAGVAPEGQKGVGHGAKQEVVDDARIPLGERIERMREREDDVKVRDREQLGPARREPAVAGNRLTRRAVAIATRVVRGPRRAAAITRVAVAAQHGRAARGDRP